MIERHYVTPPSGLRMKYKAQFDLAEFYKAMKLFIEDEGFLKDEQTLEKEYGERAIPGGKQIEFAWAVQKKENEYITYKVEIAARTLVIEPNNDIDMKFIAWVESGGEDFDKLGFFTRLYHIMIQKPRIPAHQTELYKKVYKFQNEAKKILGVMDYK